MRYFARLNSKGNIVVVFRGKDEKDKREGTVEITEEVYNQWIEHKGWILNNGQLIPPPQKTLSLSEVKVLKFAEIKEKFQNAIKFGVIDFTIPSSGIQVQVDARRNTSNNDLQNVEGLINLIQAGVITAPIQYKCYDNNKYSFTLQDLIALKYALMGYGLQLYAKKHYLEDLVSNATTVEEVNNINW